MFTKPRIIIVLLYSICITYSQNYRNVDEIKDDWLEHTKFQKQELLSFCDFLIDDSEVLVFNSVPDFKLRQMLTTTVKL